MAQVPHCYSDGRQGWSPHRDDGPDLVFIDRVLETAQTFMYLEWGNERIVGLSRHHRFAVWVRDPSHERIWIEQ